MRLTIVTNECPVPAIHGGRVDAWNRIRAFAAAGVDLQILFWHRDTDIPERADIEALEEVSESVVPIQIDRSLADSFIRVLKTWKYPISVNARDIKRPRQDQIDHAVRQFRPDAVWLDGIFGGKLALRLADELEKPLFYRSQNVEFQYYRDLYKSAVGVRQRSLAGLKMLRMQPFEWAVISRSEVVWDISMKDMSFWRGLGVENVEWLPPFVSPAAAADPESSIASKPEFDLAYLGNLYMPNNLEGLTWFTKNIWPVIRGSKADASLLLAGSRPDGNLKDITSPEGIEFLPNATNAEAIYSRARVLINPILTGSGVNVKTVEMLASGKPVITCPQGIAGLPDRVGGYCCVANTAEEFASFCLAELQGGNGEMHSRDLSEFSFGAIRPVIDRIQAVLLAN